mmetsp:Transcript_39295/g.81558  ORF Transcript_39295/g.81558 Transcript_39295/m.81558 type:complete len:229 (+) Transcript_39295:566-1252(+)
MKRRCGTYRRSQRRCRRGTGSQGRCYGRCSGRCQQILMSGESHGMNGCIGFGGFPRKDRGDLILDLERSKGLIGNGKSTDNFTSHHISKGQIQPSLIELFQILDTHGRCGIVGQQAIIVGRGGPIAIICRRTGKTEFDNIGIVDTKGVRLQFSRGGPKNPIRGTAKGLVAHEHEFNGSDGLFQSRNIIELSGPFDTNVTAHFKHDQFDGRRFLSVNVGCRQEYNKNAE